MFVQTYPSGADIQVWITDGSRPNFKSDETLDIQSITIIEDGQVRPLFDHVDHLAKHFAYSTRMINGSFVFNFSADHVYKFRSGSIYRPRSVGGFQSIHGRTLWIVMTKVNWYPETEVVRDVIRMDHVWEHPFRHEPEPTAVEQVPFSARSMQIVERAVRTIDPDEVGAFAADPEQYRIDGRDLLRYEQEVIMAKVVYVQDADTLKVVPVGEDPADASKWFEVRLIGANAPEDPWKMTFKDETGEVQKPEIPDETDLNKAALDTAWDTLHGQTGGPTYGQNDIDDAQYWLYPALAGGLTPTPAQLDLWGRYATLQVKSRLADKTVRLVRDPGVAPFDDFGRRLFRVEVLESGMDLSKWLIENGLATVFYVTSVNLVGGEYTNRINMLEELQLRAREKAGSPDAKGIWRQLDVVGYTP